MELGRGNPLTHPVYLHKKYIKMENTVFYGKIT